MSEQPQAGVLQVYIFKEGEFLGTDIFAERTVVVGRDPTVADLVLESSQVSRKHAVLERVPGRIVIRDAGSTNGIFVNSKKVEGETEVTRLDEIAIGEFSLKIKVVSRGRRESIEMAETRIGPSPIAEAAALAEAAKKAAQEKVQHEARLRAEREAEERKARERAEREAEERLAQERAAREAEAVQARNAKAAHVPMDEAATVATALPQQNRPANPDLSDWDDVASDELDAGSQRKPKAEFRDRPEVLDKNRFGQMLEGIGISKTEPERAHPSQDNVATIDEPRGKLAGAAADPAPAAKAHKAPEVHPVAQPAKPGSVSDTPASAPPEPVVAHKEVPPSDEAFAASANVDGEHEHVEDDEDHDDHDDDELNFVAPFSLVAHLRSENPGLPKGQKPNTVEIIDIQGEQIADARVLSAGQEYWIGPELGLFNRVWARELPPRVRLVQVDKEGTCRLEVRKQVETTVHRGGRPMKLESVPEVTRNRRRGTLCLNLKDQEVVEVVDGSHLYAIRYVGTPPSVRDPRPLTQQMRPDKQTSRSLLASLGGHVVFAIVTMFLSSGEAVQLPQEKKEEFVEVALDNEPKLEEPTPIEETPPPKQEEPKAALEKVPESMSAKPLPKGVKPRAGGTSKAPPGVLGLLSKRGSSAAPGPAAAVAAVSNLLAAKGPGGVSGGYKVSGLIGKLPSNTLSVGGCGGGLMTKGGAALLRGGGGGGGLLAGKAGTRTVGGLVQKDPKAMRQVGQGQLDRDEIQKVINDNIGAIQRCYERELLKASGLSGKIQVEWTIATSGSVRAARQTFTSMNNTNVSNCIMGSIRTWRFPKPRGGEVIVNYPFLFKSIGF